MVLHLIPLLDGSVLQILLQPNDKVELRLAVLDAPQINSDHISSLVDDLSDPQDTKRNAAFANLPTLEEAVPEPTIEAVA